MNRYLKVLPKLECSLNRPNVHSFQPTSKYLATSLPQMVASLTPRRSKTAVQRFLGMVGFYRHHIPSFAQRTYHLRELLQKDKKFQPTAMVTSLGVGHVVEIKQRSGCCCDRVGAICFAYFLTATLGRERERSEGIANDLGRLGIRLWGAQNKDLGSTSQTLLTRGRTTSATQAFVNSTECLMSLTFS